MLARSPFPRNEVTRYVAPVAAAAVDLIYGEGVARSRAHTPLFTTV